jgi:hypothetical protein
MAAERLVELGVFADEEAASYREALRRSPRDLEAVNLPFCDRD